MRNGSARDSAQTSHRDVEWLSDSRCKCSTNCSWNCGAMRNTTRQCACCPIWCTLFAGPSGWACPTWLALPAPTASLVGSPIARWPYSMCLNAGTSLETRYLPGFTRLIVSQKCHVLGRRRSLGKPRLTNPLLSLCGCHCRRSRIMKPSPYCDTVPQLVRTLSVKGRLHTEHMFLRY